MIANDSNKSKGCLGWLSGIGGAILGLLTAVASCAGILQYIESAPPTEQAPANPAAVVVITSQPVSNNIQSNNAQTSVSPEQRQAVTDFLSSAIAAEITAYQYSDPSYASMFYGDALRSLQDEILDLSSRGVFLSARFDYDNSYIHDMRVGQNDRIEVDSCEYWANDYYDQLTGTLLGSDDWTLVPQMIVIENINAGLYITSIAFYTGQAFCQ